jgi:hypothetical protein
MEAIMPILQGVEDSVVNSNFKYKGEIGLDQVSLQREEAIAHWGAMNKVREGFLTRALQSFAQEDVSEAMAQQQMRTGNSVAESNSAIGLTTVLVSALSQVLAKLAQSTPPETAVPK